MIRMHRALPLARLIALRRLQATAFAPFASPTC
jgi:hypothetical protein